MLNVVKPTSDSVVVVVGAGAVGLSALMSLKTLPSPPAQVIAVDVVSERLELAKSFGATHIVNSRESPDLKDALMKITENQGVDGAIDTTGRPDVVNTLLKSVAKKGIVVTVGVGSVCFLCWMKPVYSLLILRGVSSRPKHRRIYSRR